MDISNQKSIEENTKEMDMKMQASFIMISEMVKMLKTKDIEILQKAEKDAEEFMKILSLGHPKKLYVK